MFYPDGYRPNIGIILVNKDNQVFFAKRSKENAWQFPQGGKHEREAFDECMYRELKEEIGLESHHVEIIARTRSWLYYNVPRDWVKSGSNYKGQKQIWYLLRFVGHDHHVNLRNEKPYEFDAWRWVDYHYPATRVVYFKREVYQQALKELVKYLDGVHYE